MVEALRAIAREELSYLAAELPSAPPAPAVSSPGEDDLFMKAFQLAPMSGDYVEFGVFKGASLIRAYRAAFGWVHQLCHGRADHLVDEPAELRRRVESLWSARRFFGFDSFEGMPEPAGVDRARVIWRKGTFASPLEELQRRLAEAGVPREKVVTVKGFFSDSLTEANRVRLGIERIAVAHIDSDLCESARLALAFITPALQNGTVIIFDEWFAYRGHPLMGEQLAFREWQEAHPDWLVTEYQCAGVTSKAFLVNRRERPVFRDRLAEIVE